MTGPQSKPFPLRLSLFLSALGIITLINLLGAAREARRIQGFRAHTPHQSVGNEFMGLETFLQGVDAIGYYTDSGLKENKDVMTFGHAQYVLAPVLLEHNNFDHEYTLFVCSSEQAALKKIIEIGAVPVKKNPFGMILARTRP